MTTPKPLTRAEIDAKRAAALERQRAENEELLARQEAIHALAYKLHQDAHNDESIEEKPGFDVSLGQATKVVDAKIAEIKAEIAAAEARAAAAADEAEKARVAAAVADEQAREKTALATAAETDAKATEGDAGSPAEPGIESTEQSISTEHQ